MPSIPMRFSFHLCNEAPKVPGQKPSRARDVQNGGVTPLTSMVSHKANQTILTGFRLRDGVEPETATLEINECCGRSW